MPSRESAVFAWDTAKRPKPEASVQIVESDLVEQIVESRASEDSMPPTWPSSCLTRNLLLASSTCPDKRLRNSSSSKAWHRWSLSSSFVAAANVFSIRFEGAGLAISILTTRMASRLQSHPTLKMVAVASSRASALPNCPKTNENLGQRISGPSCSWCVP